MNRLFAVSLAVLAAGALLLAAQRIRGRDDSTASGTPDQWSASELSSFDEYPVLWLGEEFQGLKLSHSVRDAADDDSRSPLPIGQDGFLFVYGTCDPGSDDGCAVPLAVRSTTKCAPGEPIPPGGVEQMPTVRGAARRLDAGSATYVWTAGVVVSLSGDPALVEAAVDSLQVANPGSKEPLIVGTRGELPPPARSCG